MRALSLWQPWASLVAHGVKAIETRGPRPSKSFRGPLAIHAAKRFDRDFLADLRRRYTEVRDLPPGMPTGALVAVVRVVEVREMTKEWIRSQTALERELGDWQVGRFGWCIGDVVPLDPIPCVGRQGLFRPSWPSTRAKRRHPTCTLLTAAQLLADRGGWSPGFDAFGPWKCEQCNGDMEACGTTCRECRDADACTCEACPTCTGMLWQRPGTAEKLDECLGRWWS